MKLEALANDIGRLGVLCAVVAFHVLFLRFFIEHFVRRDMDLFGGEDPEKPSGYIREYVEELLGYAILGVAIIVVGLPEGLPIAVMISLAYSVREMLKDQNFVKRLASCEIMGGANNICSDKTGTLTMNKMILTNLYIEEDHKVKVNDETLNLNDYFKSEKVKKLFVQSITCNTSGSVKEASATEQAMLLMME
jgi:P-type Ca2+ transporter type 2B